MENRTKDVAEFFGSIAAEYGDKYERQNAFHHYFFNERLDEAVRGRDFAARRVLDVGAGTGRLYDRIVAGFPSVDYYGVDISAEMLAASAIPAERRFVGTLADVTLPAREFDYIFLLGVTTYIGDEELKETLAQVHRLLAPEGRAVVTFTNRRSADWIARRIIRKLPGIRRKKQFVLAQEFPTYARSMTEIDRMVSELFSIERSVGLNHTVFPLNQLLKTPSVGIAKQIHGLREGSGKLILSSDILVELVKR